MMNSTTSESVALTPSILVTSQNTSSSRFMDPQIGPFSVLLLVFNVWNRYNEGVAEYNVSIITPRDGTDNNNH
jgi:hypothetical protein